MSKDLFRNVALVCVLFLAACSVQENAPGEGSVIELGAANNGGQVTMKKGDIIRLQLEGNITTGYAWEPMNLDSSYLEAMGEPEYVNKTNLKGGGGVFIFRFKALKAGETQLRLIYYRSFEKDTPPEQEFLVTVRIE